LFDQWHAQLARRREGAAGVLALRPLSISDITIFLGAIAFASN
jgi:hypothetical protein